MLLNQTKSCLRSNHSNKKDTKGTMRGLNDLLLLLLLLLAVVVVPALLVAVNSVLKLMIIYKCHHDSKLLLNRWSS